VLGAEVMNAVAADAAPLTPGRVPGHYAPGTPLELVAPGQLASRLGALPPRSVGLLAPESVALGASAPALAVRRVAAADPAGYAQELYEHLHRLDASGAQILLVALPPVGADWDAIHDRLTRAAAGSPGAIIDAD
jgi:L-threonylcarbamoyladenylate synthase